MSATTTASAEAASDTLLYRLHTNESQLRTLAIVLSLTGGLALSFLLGVGIFIYWHCRQYKQRKRKTSVSKQSRNDTLNSLAIDHPPPPIPLHWAHHQHDGREVPHQPQNQQQHHHQHNQQQHNQPDDETSPLTPPAPPIPIHLPPQLLLPPEMTNSAETPAPSAPPAKEMRPSTQVGASTLARSTSSSCVHDSHDSAAVLFRPNCHHCSPPPPAYTPPLRTGTNVQFIDPE